jgi:hypothetical protein
MHSYNGISLGMLPPEWEGAFSSQKWKEDVRANLIKVVLNTREEYDDFKTKVTMKYIHKQTPSGRLVQNACGEFGLRRLDKLHPGGSITYLSDFDRLSKFPATLFFGEPKIATSTGCAPSLSSLACGVDLLACLLNRLSTTYFTHWIWA